MLIFCDDGNFCMLDICESVIGCVITNTFGGLCSDGNNCTEDDQCVDGVCEGIDIGCECSMIPDCLVNEDGDLCNGTLICSVDILFFKCEVDL